MTNPIKNFFLFCSGASRTILNQKECEVEHNKYAGIGATIFFTAALAALSGGYAMFTVFRSTTLSVAFGLFWGLIIFNLDRFIVSSIRKKAVGAKKGGELRKAVPRLFLAIFISIVITRPLELKLFQVEIEGQITKDLIGERVKLESDINSEYADIPKLEEATEKLRTRRAELQDEWNKRTKAARGELEGWDGTTNPGDGPEYKRRLAEATQAKQELDAFKEQYDPIIKTNEAQINKRKQERDDKIAAAKTQIDNSRGLLKRLEALSKLTTEHLSVFFASGFIILLFISLETAPILVKLFSSRGPYDDYLDAAEHQVNAYLKKKQSDTNDEINTNVALSKQRNVDRLQAESQLSRQLYAERIKVELQLTKDTLASLQTLAGQELQDAQVEFAKTAVERWKEGQLNLLSQLTPGAHYYGQPATPAHTSAAPPSTHTSSQNIPPPSGSTGIPPPTGAGSAPPHTASPSNNGGAHPSAGTATAGTQPPAPATTPSGPSSTAQQTSSGAGQQSGTGTTPAPAGSNSNTVVP